VKWVANGAVDGGAHYIRGVVMVGFAELVTSAGGDPIALVEKAGFSKDVLSEPDGLISWGRLGVLMELAAVELDKPSFGLDWALSVPSHFPNVGPVPLMAHFVETARELAKSIIQYWRYHTNALALQLLDDRTSPLRHRPLPQRVAGPGVSPAHGIHAGDRMPAGAHHDEPRRKPDIGPIQAPQAAGYHPA
jgi:hypothetical protein